MCSGGTIKSDIAYVKDFSREFLDFERTIANWTSSYMCTQTCPCDTSVTPSKWSETRLNKYGRTNRVINSNFTDVAKNKTYVGFWIPPDNYGVQPNFYNCYQNKLSTFNASKRLNISDYQQVLNILKQIEASFKCNGVCDYGNFYFFIDVSQGPPSKTCQDTLETIFSNISLNVGIALGVTFIFTFLAICQ
jgi:hypothetical protein